MKSFRLLLAGATIFSSTAFAGGFEKNIMWSGQYGGRAGAAVSSVEGAEALFWNPARLVKGEAAQDVSLNFSPTFSTYEAPVASADTSIESEQALSPIFGLFYRNRLAENMALGVGVYVSGGSKVEYKDVAYNANITEDAASDLSLTELSIGLGYDLNSDWSVGASWRLGMVNAAYKINAPSSTPAAGYAIFDYKDLAATSVDGLRIGVNYSPVPEWGIGLNFRSRFGFTAEGKVDFKYRVNANGSTVATGSEDAEIATELPQQISLGGHYQFNEMWTGFWELVSTSYGNIESLRFDSQGSTVADVNVITEWNDQTNIRLAAEYKGWGMPFRFGYVYTTAVVPEDRAVSTLSTPGVGHTLTAGTTYKFDDSWMLHASLDYSTASGEVADQTTALDGDYSSKAYALNLGMGFNF